MAYTSIHSIKATDGAALRYITNGDKTVNGLYVQSYACRADSKDYAVDGKAPKRSEVETMLADLKTEYEALVPEHNAFLKKKAAAAPYTKTVRTYLENQKKRERDRQYQERKRTQQRKNDTLE